MSRTSKAEVRQAARTAVVKLLRQRLGDARIFPYRGRGTSDVVAQLVADYNAGLILATPDQRAAVPEISKSSVWGWWRAFKERGEEGLGDRYRGRTTSTWSKYPELGAMVCGLWTADTDLSAEQIRDRIEATAREKGWPMPPARTIGRMLKKLREKTRAPAPAPSHHSRRSFFGRYPLLGAAADALFTMEPSLSIEAIRDRLKPIAVKEGWPTPSLKTLSGRRRGLSEGGFKEA